MAILAPAALGLSLGVANVLIAGRVGDYVGDRTGDSGAAIWAYCAAQTVGFFVAVAVIVAVFA